MKNPVRIEITDVFGNVSYIVLDSHKVRYFGSDDTPFALSNIASENAARLRFALEDAENESDVSKAMKLAKFARTFVVLP